MSDPGSNPLPNPRVGLCAGCRHAVVQRSAKGSEFWRCRRAEELGDPDEGFLRYPPLPVAVCRGFEAGAPGQANTADSPRGTA